MDKLKNFSFVDDKIIVNLATEPLPILQLLTALCARVRMRKFRGKQHTMATFNIGLPLQIKKLLLVQPNSAYVNAYFRPGRGRLRGLH